MKFPRDFLELFGIGVRKEKRERRSKGQVGKGWIKQLQHALLHVSTCMCIFLPRFGMHGIACASFAVVAWVLQGVTIFSS